MSQHPVQRPGQAASKEEEVVAVEQVQVTSGVILWSYCGPGNIMVMLLCVSPCSSSCSGGTRRRTRTCVGERGECYGR